MTGLSGDKNAAIKCEFKRIYPISFSLFRHELGNFTLESVSNLPVHRFVRPAIIGHLYLLYLCCPPNSCLWQLLNYTILTSRLFRTSVSIARRYVRHTFRSWYHASSMQISVSDSTNSSRPVARPLLTHGNAKTRNTHRVYTHARWGVCTSTLCSGVSQTAKTAKGRICSPVAKAYIHLRISILHFPFPPHKLLPIVLIWL